MMDKIMLQQSTVVSLRCGSFLDNDLASCTSGVWASTSLGFGVMVAVVDIFVIYLGLETIRKAWKRFASKATMHFWKRLDEGNCDNLD